MPRSTLIERLRPVIRGEVIGPDDPAYDTAPGTVYAGRPRHPAAIVRPVDPDDVAQAVTIARDDGLELAVRSGGHSGAGHSTTDGGLLIDLREMRAIDVDPHARTAWAGSGATAGEVTAAAGAHGLAVGFGDTASVGIGGITLGGGVDYLVRKHGLTIDSLHGAEIVTADGRLRRIDAEHDPDLFWAIRGGGGNFGVVTRFGYRLHELPSIVGGMLMLPASAEVIAGFMRLNEEAPDELSAIANIMPAPPMSFVPAEHHGEPVVMALMTWAGPTERGEAVLAPFRALATPIVDQLRPMTYPEMFPPEEGDGDEHPAAVSRTLFVDHVDEPLARHILDRIAAHMATNEAHMAVAQLRVLGGAMARVPADATAFGHRSQRIMVNVAALYAPDRESAIHDAWVSRLADELNQGYDRVYVNFLGAEGADTPQRAYPDATWRRLVEVKRRYDPTNLFRRNHNVAPGESA